MSSLSKVLLFVFYAVAVGLLVFICSHLLIKFGHRFGWFQVPGANGRNQNPKSATRPTPLSRRDKSFSYYSNSTCVAFEECSLPPRRALRAIATKLNVGALKPSYFNSKTTSASSNGKRRFWSGIGCNGAYSG
jgi:hypothetical protein